MDKKRILIVEDEEKIVQILRDYLEKEGFAVSALYEGTDAVATVKSSPPDFLILDLMLPGMDGVSICREVRKFSELPILMLTARVDEIDRLIGLEMGADDYVCKPFLPREVVARVKAILRRTHAISASSPTKSEAETPALNYREISLHPERFECTAAGQAIELTPVEFRLLQTLLSHPGHVHSRNKLMDVAYTDRRIVSDRTIDSHIKNLRRKLAAALPGDELIHSIYGVGYKLE
ncbi:MAG: response regulator [bacterium]